MFFSLVDYLHLRWVIRNNFSLIERKSLFTSFPVRKLYEIYTIFEHIANLVNCNGLEVKNNFADGTSGHLAIVENELFPYRISPQNCQPAMDVGITAYG